MSLVIDASMALAWIFPDEKSALADSVLDRVIATGAYVPLLWKLEIANVLRAAVRRQRCTEEFEGLSIRRLERISVFTDRETDAHAWAATRRLATQYDLTIYDACYLELAKRRSLPLATLDAKLGDAGRCARVEVIFD